jgi:hypothetical protein
VVILAQIRQCVETGTGEIARPVHRANGNNGNGNGNGDGDGERSLRRLNPARYCDGSRAKCADFRSGGACCAYHGSYCGTSNCEGCGCEGRRTLGFLEDHTTRILTQPEIVAIKHQCTIDMKALAEELRAAEDSNNCLGTPNKLKCVAWTFD